MFAPSPDFDWNSLLGEKEKEILQKIKDKYGDKKGKLPRQYGDFATLSGNEILFEYLERLLDEKPELTLRQFTKLMEKKYDEVFNAHPQADW